ncbi:MAG TPA: hypothetical protein IAB38_04540 [Candidatus Onthousia excrementipullorum]|uniref:Uncharacterized protein n=1 Tax=Candidatus Onthousia excrementipullorum TaxID=2840884 RepID=A0A9D1DUZ5_9FIRM|nr:hypothetical protein [Candidatus Onthousia excrementipullorum]
MKVNKVLAVILVVVLIIIMVGIIYICYNISDLKEDNGYDSNYNYTDNNGSNDSSSISDYIGDAKKDTFITLAQQASNEVRLNFVNGYYASPSNEECVAVSVNSTSIDSTSPFDSPISDNSYVIIYNNNGSYDYYIQMTDFDGNGFGVYEENDIDRDSVVKNNVNNDSKFQIISNGSTINLFSKDGNSTCKVVGVY